MSSLSDSGVSSAFATTRMQSYLQHPATQSPTRTAWVRTSINSKKFNKPLGDQTQKRNHNLPTQFLNTRTNFSCPPQWLTWPGVVGLSKVSNGQLFHRPWAKMYKGLQVAGLQNMPKKTGEIQRYRLAVDPMIERVTPWNTMRLSQERLSKPLLTLKTIHHLRFPIVFSTFGVLGIRGYRPSRFKSYTLLGLQP